jgi:hypothetical protein
MAKFNKFSPSFDYMPTFFHTSKTLLLFAHHFTKKSILSPCYIHSSICHWRKSTTNWTAWRKIENLRIFSCSLFLFCCCHFVRSYARWTQNKENWDDVFWEHVKRCVFFSVSGNCSNVTQVKLFLHEKWEEERELFTTICRILFHTAFHTWCWVWYYRKFFSNHVFILDNIS